MHGQHIDLRHGELFLAAGLKKAAADAEAGVVDEKIDALVRQRLAETGALALLLQISRQDAAEGTVFRGELCGQSFESVGAAGGEDEPEAEAGIPAGKLPANAGRSSGYPYSFGHKLLLVKSGSLIDGFQLVSGEGGVVQGSGGRAGWSSVQEMQHTWRETSFLLFYPIVARKNGRIHIKVQRPGIFAAGGAVRKKKKR